MDRAREIVSVGSFRDWRWDARLFEGFAVYSKFLPDTNFGTGRRERLEGAQVSAELSRLPGIGPRIMPRGVAGACGLAERSCPGARGGTPRDISGLRPEEGVGSSLWTGPAETAG